MSKRYSITLGNFSTKEEAEAFMQTLIKNYAEGWTPGEPTIFSDSCEVEEFEVACGTCKHYRNKTCWSDISGWYLEERPENGECNTGWEMGE